MKLLIDQNCSHAAVFRCSQLGPDTATPHPRPAAHSRGELSDLGPFCLVLEDFGKALLDLYVSLYFHLTSTPPSAAVDKDIQRSVDM